MSGAVSNDSLKTLLPGRVAGTPSIVQIEYDTAIQAVDELIHPPDVDQFVAPGFIDLQVNGFAGVDYNDPFASHEAIAQSIRRIFMTGVTRFLPTVITGSEEYMIGALRNLTSTKEELGRNGMPESKAIEAFHVEGPHISPEDGPRGAHPVKHVRPPDIEEFKRWQDAAKGHVRLVTLSPEWEQAPSYVNELVRSGVVVSIGHTKATCVQIMDAISAGATMSTHLGNGAHSMLPKTENYIWDQLAADGLTPSFIADGIHIPSAFLIAAIRAKGVERSVLVTDAVMPAMCDPGFYRLGQVEVELRQDGRVVLRGGARLAGSSLRMDHAIGNAIRLGSVSLREALAMATINPARAARIAGRQRGLSPGDKADFVRFRWDDRARSLTVIETIAGGDSVYQA
ncbi:MAG: N-acetylglucosamine-6-phosphate deacetylase [Bryobacteraceae bacterium]